MQWNLARTVDPTSSPVTVDEVKDQSRIDGSAEDMMVSRLIDAATASIDGPYGVGVCLAEQTWELKLDCFPDCIKIPLYPVLSVEEIEYEAPDGATQTVDTEVYRVDTHSNPARITVDPNHSWPTPLHAAGVVTVTFKAGYETVPEDLKHAIIMLVAHWYENREAVTLDGTPQTMPMAVDAILNRYRVPGVA